MVVTVFQRGNMVKVGINELSMVNVKVDCVIFSKVIEGCNCGFIMAFHVSVGSENCGVAPV